MNQTSLFPFNMGSTDLVKGREGDWFVLLLDSRQSTMFFCPLLWPFPELQGEEIEAEVVIIMGR